MALRENTGLQVALILFVMITVALAVSTYVYWDSANQSQKKEDAAMATLDQRDKSLDEANNEIIELRAMLGYKIVQEGGPQLPEMKKNYETDKSLFGEGWEKEKNYRTLPDFLTKELVKLNNAIAKLTEDKAVIVAQLDAARQQEVTNTTKYRDQQVAANDDLAKVTIDYRTRTEATQGLQNDLQVKLDDSNKKAAAEKMAKDKELEAYLAKMAKLQAQRDTAIAKVEATQGRGTTSEQPDGQITWVSQEGGTVYINLGSADALQRSTTFTVYNAGTANLATAEPKASLEVTTIRGPHLAEARIVEDSLGDPILSRDMIFSPVWNPGQRTHFALIGFMDIDGDGKSDRSLVRSLILQNGGEIDAEVLDDGVRKGKLSINTRHLVEGASANEKSSPEVLAASSQMRKEAEDLGIETITVERLLSDMGWRGSERTVSAGTGSAGGGFKTLPKESSTPATGGAFQPRSRPGVAPRRTGSY